MLKITGVVAWLSGWLVGEIFLENKKYMFINKKTCDCNSVHQHIGSMP